MEKLKNSLELFLQSCSYFSALYWVLKDFSKTSLFLLVISYFNSWFKNSPGPPVGRGPPVGPWPTCRRQPTWLSSTRWLGRSDPAILRGSPSPSSLALALATESPSPPPRSIPTALVGASRRDGVRSIDPAMALLPVREILSIVSRCPRLRRIPHLGFRPWRPRASPRAARPFPWWDPVLVRDVPCRCVVGTFPWLGAIVATRALPHHATVVPPGCSISPLLRLLLSSSSWS
jgi:hypothetical protein